MNAPLPADPDYIKTAFHYTRVPCHSLNAPTLLLFQEVFTTLIGLLLLYLLEHTAIILDDDALSILYLESLITSSDLPIRVTGKAHSLEEGLELLNGPEPDFLFLDVKLQGEQYGLDLLNKWTPRSTKVILYTGHMEFELFGILKGISGILSKPATLDCLHQLVTDNI